MKKILAMAAMAALAAGASAYAANPFSDVSTSDWAYQAISDLSDRGLIDGYPDGAFKGQQSITRFEVAQIIARLMAKEDQMNAEDRAIIDRLASEYGTELQNFGVRVGNLEKKIGNIVWTGDARMRYQRASTVGYIKDNPKKRESFNGRIRINARANVNENTYVHGRLVANAYFDNMLDSEGETKDGGDVSMDRLYVHHNFGKVGATLGRYELDLGQQLGGWLYAEKFDGVEVTAPLGSKVNLTLGYGRMKAAVNTVNKNNYTDYSKAETFYAQAKGDLGFAKLGVDYVKVANNDKNEGKKSVWGVNLFVPISNFRIFGDYYTDTKENARVRQKGKIWTVGLGYGAKNLQKAGTYNLDVAYYKVKGGLYAGGTGLQLLSADALLGNDSHFWLASGDVVVAKNTYVHGEYAFSSKIDNMDKSASSWTLSLNYKF